MRSPMRLPTYAGTLEAYAPGGDPLLPAPRGFH